MLPSPATTSRCRRSTRRARQRLASATDPRHRAVISIGTNSTRLLVVRKDRQTLVTVAQEAIGTRLGEGLRESGHLADVPVRRTLDAVRTLAFEAKSLSPTLYAIATSAVRRADNASVFADSIANITGGMLDVLSGDDEARYSFAGALAAHPPATRSARVGVLDVGGGSSEYALGSSIGVDQSVSCEIGAVRLTERATTLGGLGGAKPDQGLARSIAREALAPLAALRGAHAVYAVGGTATTIAAILQNGNRDAIDGMLVDRADIAAVLARIIDLPLAKRRTVPGLNPQRADIFPAGAIVVDEALAMLAVDRLTVSVGDLLLGYLYAREAHTA